MVAAGGEEPIDSSHIRRCAGRTEVGRQRCVVVSLVRKPTVSVMCMSSCVPARSCLVPPLSAHSPGPYSFPTELDRAEIDFFLFFDTYYLKVILVPFEVQV